MQMTKSELIDKVLENAKNGQAVLARDTPDDYSEALNEAEERKFIRDTGSGYRLTSTGRDVLDLGGFDKWREHKNKIQENATKPLFSVGNNAIIGDNNSGNNQGRDFFDLPQSQPETKPTTNPVQTVRTK